MADRSSANTNPYVTEAKYLSSNPVVEQLPHQVTITQVTMLQANLTQMFRLQVITVITMVILFNLPTTHKPREDTPILLMWGKVEKKIKLRVRGGYLGYWDLLPLLVLSSVSSLELVLSAVKAPESPLLQNTIRTTKRTETTSHQPITQSPTNQYKTSTTQTRTQTPTQT